MHQQRRREDLPGRRARAPGRPQRLEARPVSASLHQSPVPEREAHPRTQDRERRDRPCAAGTRVGASTLRAGIIEYVFEIYVQSSSINDQIVLLSISKILKIKNILLPLTIKNCGCVPSNKIRTNNNKTILNIINFYINLIVVYISSQ